MPLARKTRPRYGYRTCPRPKIPPMVCSKSDCGGGLIEYTWLSPRGLLRFYRHYTRVNLWACWSRFDTPPTERADR